MQKTLTMTDLHSHILFGMDDGARNIDESIRMLKAQIAQGVTQVVLTPHFSPLQDKLSEFLEKRDANYKLLKEAVKEENLDIELKIGAEILFSIELLNMDLSDLVIEGTNFLLLEFSTRSHIHNLKNSIIDLTNNGYDIIFAHIERYSFLRDNLELMQYFIESGVLYQVNGSSFLRSADKNFLKACIKHNYIHLVASDAHSLSTRKPNLEKAYAAISSSYGDEAVDYFIENANSAFDDQQPNIKNPTKMRNILGRYL